MYKKYSSVEWVGVAMFNLEDCLAFITNRSGKIFSEALEKEFRPYNITRSQWIAMYYINTHKSMTQRELAEELSIKEPSVVRLLQKLEAEGYLLRSIDDADKRMKQIQLSDLGTQVCLKLLPIAEKFKQDTIAGISQDDLRIFESVLQRMVDNTRK
ncbi:MULTISPECIES: MarR family winged helix-turn-helix transcriptional regulator [Paenibacillus]|uniref:MarR family winged helix-turn-helix transcriptional regulator n=2 Tax=Paenibacillus TaxID=44249 RepID=UPI001E59AFBC|nr:MULTISPECIES: MarR family transcriptional regulator [Paenibacillus]WOZ39091.1 MarR family transcriptional regulator [Paenibacillus polymyxa]